MIDHIHLVQNGIWTVNELRQYEATWNALMGSHPLVLSKDAALVGLATHRCRYCKHIVHGDECTNCGAPQ